MYDDNGKTINEATPGTPVQVVGWKSFPISGEIILEANSEVTLCIILNYNLNYLYWHSYKSFISSSFNKFCRLYYVNIFKKHLILNDSV